MTFECSEDLLDILAENGPREILETCLKPFTALTLGEQFPINYLGQRYCQVLPFSSVSSLGVHILDSHTLRVHSLVPPNAASLLGDVDLEVEFAPPCQQQQVWCAIFVW